MFVDASQFPASEPAGRGSASAVYPDYASVDAGDSGS